MCRVQETFGINWSGVNLEWIAWVHLLGVTRVSFYSRWVMEAEECSVICTRPHRWTVSNQNSGFPPQITPVPFLRKCCEIFRSLCKSSLRNFLFPQWLLCISHFRDTLSESLNLLSFFFLVRGIKLITSYLLDKRLFCWAKFPAYLSF